MLTANRVRQVLSYNRKTGVIKWKQNTSTSHRAIVGSVAGSRDHKGYLKIMIDGERHMAHRLIWLIVHNRWPKRYLDHINGIKDDNRLCNLREANDSQNKANGSAYRNNRTGIKGAYYEPWRTSFKKWRSVIRKDGKLFHIGYFATPEEANEAYLTEAKKTHGIFARAA